MNMRYPSAKKLKEMERKLRSTEGPSALSPNASLVEKLKYDLVKQIVAYIRIHRVTQAELADILRIDPARISEIVNYKLEKFTVDTLLFYNSVLNPGLEVKVRSAI
jgi:predicted XRE-type DNA-binding protein